MPPARIRRCQRNHHNHLGRSELDHRVPRGGDRGHHSHLLHHQVRLRDQRSCNHNALNVPQLLLCTLILQTQEGAAERSEEGERELHTQRGPRKPRGQHRRQRHHRQRERPRCPSD